MLPNINKNNGIWEGTIQLDFWEGFFETNGSISLNIGGNKLIKEVNETHINGYYYLIDNQSIILNSILYSLKEIYYKLQEEYNYNGNEKSKYMPDIPNNEGFKNLLKPYKIFILDISKDKMPYIGFQFQCTWDYEHGLGVMTHNGIIVKIADADISFLSWIAEEDLNKIERCY